LAAVLIIGPRDGRYKDGKLQLIPGSNPTLALMGGLFFVIGWIGFNGGSTLALNDEVPGIIVNTLLAATSGSATAYFLLRLRPGIFIDELLAPVNGALAGLVSITASAHAVSTGEAVLIGSFGAIIMLIIDDLMIRNYIDDPIAAVPVHLGAGIWGTLCVAFFGDPAILQTGLSFSEQLFAQVTGIVSVGLWAFLIAFISIYTINRITPLPRLSGG
jgi:Amt family ammonium transporter